MSRRRTLALALVAMVVFLLVVPATFAAKPGGEGAKPKKAHPVPGVAQGVGKKVGQAGKVEGTGPAPGAAKGQGKTKIGPTGASGNEATGTGKVRIGGQAGKSSTAHLALVAVADCKMYAGAWGKVTYKLKGGTLRFVMNAHAVRMAGQGQPDPEGGLPGSTTDEVTPPLGGATYALYAGGTLLGAAAAHGSGNVHIQGSVAWSSGLEGTVFELRPVQALNGATQGCEAVLRSGPIGNVYAARAARRAGR